MTQPRSLPSHPTVTLRPTPPFHFDATFHKPDHFPSGDNLWEPGTRWQTMRWQGQSLGLKFEDRGSVTQPEIRLSVWSEAGLSRHDLRGLVGEMDSRLDLHSNIAEFNRRFHSHPLLGPTLQRWRGMRLLNHSSLYEYLIIAFVLQNTVVRRSVSMMRALFERYGSLLEFDGRKLYCFWDPARLSRVPEGSLRRLKVGYRAKSIKRVSRAFASGEIDEVRLRGQPREVSARRC